MSFSYACFAFLVAFVFFTGSAVFLLRSIDVIRFGSPTDVTLALGLFVLVVKALADAIDQARGAR
jgi:hypothetical protein